VEASGSGRSPADSRVLSVSVSSDRRMLHESEHHPTARRGRRRSDLLQGPCSRRQWRLVLLLVATLGYAFPTQAQVGGVIEGVVLDAQDAVLPGVSLTLRNRNRRGPHGHE
jgi:hypothetical protein